MMKRHACSGTLIILCQALLLSSVEAQQSSPGAEAQLSARATALVGSRIGHHQQTRFDTRIPQFMHGLASEFRGQHGESVVRSMASAFGGTPGRLEEVFVCARQNPSTCRLVGASRFVMVSAPRVEADSARVSVFHFYPSAHPRMPVAEAVWEVLFRRRGNAWTVEHVRVIAES